MEYRYRYLARLVIECKTPLTIGSGEKSIMSDVQIARDANDIPYIPGTTIAGLIRHAIQDKALRERLMGFQNNEGGKGSLVIFTEGKLLNKDGTPIDGLQLLNADDEYIKCFMGQMSIRQHVKINDMGVAVKEGKFDEEVVPIGARFCFEMEMLDKDGQDEIHFADLLKEFTSYTFRIGSGSRSGFGAIEVINTKYRKIDLTDADDLKDYLDKPSSLSDTWAGWTELDIKPEVSDATIYKLNLKPDDFMMFTSGFGDNEADMTIVKERSIKWNDSIAEVIDREKTFLIPGSSVKGAVAHRTAFHYNRLMEYFAGDPRAKSGAENEAVRILFGHEGDNDGKKKKRGIVLFSDVLKYRKPETKEGFLNHVRIDRFTGGAIAGALFQEKPLFAAEEEVEMEIILLHEVSEKIQQSFEEALKDICKGLLPLGGGVNRGHGRFEGQLTRNGEAL